MLAIAVHTRGTNPRAVARGPKHEREEPQKAQKTQRVRDAKAPKGTNQELGMRPRISRIDTDQE